MASKNTMRNRLRIALLLEMETAPFVVRMVDL
jgi:hypothetical protein